MTELVNQLNNLPSETLNLVLQELSSDQLIEVCSLVDKRVKSVCYKETIPQRLAKYQNLALPYDEQDSLKRLILTEAIYGSSMAGAKLVHPDWACAQAIKFGNNEVFDVYYKYVTSDFELDLFAAQAGDVSKYHSKGYFDYWFDRPMTGPPPTQDIEFNIGEKIIRDEVTFISPLIIKNIVAYGKGIYTDRVIKGLRPFVNKPVTNDNYDQIAPVLNPLSDKFSHLLRFNDMSEFMTTNPKIGYGNYQFISAELFETYIQNPENKINLGPIVSGIWSWNRWDLWSILNQYHPVEKFQSNIMQESWPGHLSMLTLPIIYSLSPELFERKQLYLSRKGYYPYIKFCNKNNLPILVGATEKSTVALLFENKWYYENTVNKKSNILPVRVDTLNLLDSAPQFKSVDIPSAYYVSENTFNRLAQLAAADLDILPGKFYGPTYPVPTTMISGVEWPAGAYYAHTFSLERLFRNKNNLPKSEAATLLKELGPVLAGGDLKYIGELMGKDSLHYKFLKKASEKFNYNNFNSLLQQNKYDIIKTVASFFNLSREDATKFWPVVFKLLLKNRALFPHINIKFPTLFIDVMLDDYIAYMPVVYDSENLNSFNSKTLGKLIPGMVSVWSKQVPNPLKYAFDWLSEHGPFELNTQWSLRYFTCICPVGLDFMIKTCTPASVKKMLIAATKSNIPSEYKMVAASYL